MPADTRLLGRTARRDFLDNETDTRRQRGKLGGGDIIGLGNAESEPCLADWLFRDRNRRRILGGTDRAANQCERQEMDGSVLFRKC